MAKTGPSIAEVQDDLVMTSNRHRVYGYEVGEDGRLYANDEHGRVRIDFTLSVVSTSADVAADLATVTAAESKAANESMARDFNVWQERTDARP